MDIWEMKRRPAATGNVFGGWALFRFKKRAEHQVGNENNPGWLGYIGMIILPIYIGIIINRDKDPY